MIGTRGVPARYGGFETAIEEVGSRLVDRGHDVTVYRRREAGETTSPRTHLGMRLVTVPAIRHKVLETLSHTTLSALHMMLRTRFDAVFMFNAANSAVLPILWTRNARVAVHVDGLEWQRSKWSGAGQTYYRIAESISVRWADALIADARGIADYYDEEFDASSVLISYGAKILERPSSDRLEALGYEPGRYHLVVARFEPENHVDVVVEGFRDGPSTLPLLVVGSAPYSDEYTAQVHDLAAGDDRIRFLGPVWDQELLDQLYANALVYFHGHSVGGTNPSLLRAMGAGTAVCAFDVNFNREVLGDLGEFFDAPSAVARAAGIFESDPLAADARGNALRDRARESYDWDRVTDGYETLADDLAHGRSRRRVSSGRRRRAGAGVKPRRPGSEAERRWRK